ncbi:MAG: hypothetical protein IH830_03810 [Planctomycetes bacterium]|nr:hypothetical protein [Planctomycetota bacterium]
MPCLIGCLALATPRFAIILVVIFSNYLGAAYQTVLWPLLGFFCMPLTTLAYAWAINSHSSVTGIYLVVVVLAALMDLGVIGGGASNRRVRRYYVRSERNPRTSDH